MLNKWVFKHIDNSALIVFRILFGLLCFLESFGAILTGWVKRVLIEPKFTFSFIGFEWLQPLPGNGMYGYFGIMSVFGLLIMVGYKYRLAMISFTIMWTGTYLMQKTSYNNHYYLLVILSVIMVFLPANRYASMDVKLNPDLKSYSMPQWVKWVVVLQLFIVYTYASVAKLYPDWLNANVSGLLMRSKSDYFLIGSILQEKWLHYTLAYGGILFDGLIVPLLLFKPTRKYAFFVSIFFHLFNSFVFQIGIFPYLALAFSLFFFEPKTIQRLFLKNKLFYNKEEIVVPSYRNILIVVGTGYFIIQLLLPVRHHFIKDNVLWTEEGHRMSWRMMLRAKSGITTYRVVNNDTKKVFVVNMDQYLSRKQKQSASTKPDVIWQFAQYLNTIFENDGQDVSIYVDSKISVNGKPFKTLIDPKVDLANVSWNTFKHNDWILPSKED
ncbi:HTTM domain-containing protein [uncultured Algibacter sp.]|uniref:HTTM domain-containing protein n=1 Tax=uncultured Algibacter sp. TaxID=298659 RepID=UPI00263603E1|nr:HTTM domain-containing protein [uncultured Algibacter sp.]